jgi:hypothetical protein
LEPIKLLPHQRRGIYCHSSLPDDLGIQYQSYAKDNIVAEDKFIRILPGLGHTGARPFDDIDGWYRGYRALAGQVYYSAKWKAWSPFQHTMFPRPLKDAVLTMLLCEKRINFDGGFSRSLAVLPRDLIYYILEFMHFDWFDLISIVDVRKHGPDDLVDAKVCSVLL